MVRPTIENRTLILTLAGSALPSESGEDADWVTSPVGSTPAGSDQWKQPVRVATTADLDTGADLEEGDAVDGITLVEGDRVLVKDQATGAQNGIYVVPASGAADRAADFDDAGEVVGAIVWVVDGSQAGSIWTVTNLTAPVLDTDDIDWAMLSTGGPGGAVDAAEDGSVVVTAADTFDFRHGLDVTDPADGSARIAVDEGELDGSLITGQLVAIVWVVDGGGSTITTGVKGDLQVPFACTVTHWSVLLDQSGSIQFDVWKDIEANYPPVVGDSMIPSGTKPHVTGALKDSSSVMTGWTTAIAAGDTLRFNVDTITSAGRATLTLYATRA